MGKKNSQLHLVLETGLWESLKREASDIGVSVSELCRKKLGADSQLTRIEMKLEKLSCRVNGLEK